MDIIVIKPLTNPLSPNYPTSFSDTDYSYPTLEHFCNYKLLVSLDAVSELQHVLAYPSAEESSKALRTALSTKFPKDFAEIFRDRIRYIYEGLELRYDQDKSFSRVLIATGDMLIIYAETSDAIWGIGMPEDAFRSVVKKQNLTTASLRDTMAKGTSITLGIGLNQFGLALMQLRDTKRYTDPSAWTLAGASAQAYGAEGAVNDADLYYDASDFEAAYQSADQQTAQSYYAPPEEQVVDKGESAETLQTTEEDSQAPLVHTSDQIIVLKGIFRPLSNCYALPVRINNTIYNSVQHYCYQQLLSSLGLGHDAETIRACPEPEKVRQLTLKIIQAEGALNAAAIQAIKPLFDASFSNAMKMKFSQYPLLLKLLLATKTALLVEDLCPEDGEWSIGLSEEKFHAWLNAYSISGHALLYWLRHRDQCPEEYRTVFGQNRTGVTLMDIREELSKKTAGTTAEYTFTEEVSPVADFLSSESITDETGLLCFGKDSVFSPFFDLSFEIPGTKNRYPTVQHYVYTEAAKFLQFSNRSIEQISQAKIGKLCETFAAAYAATYPDVALNTEWFYARESFAMKFAFKLKFSADPSFTRTLLATGEDLLVYCSDVLTTESYLWSCGLPEKQLRAWMKLNYLGTSQIYSWFTDDRSSKPNCLGSNRVGIILMELRKEFRDCVTIPIPVYEDQFSFAEELARIFGDASLAQQCVLEEATDEGSEAVVSSQEAKLRETEKLKDVILKRVAEIRKLKQQVNSSDEQLRPEIDSLEICSRSGIIYRNGISILDSSSCQTPGVFVVRKHFFSLGLID